MCGEGLLSLGVRQLCAGPGPGPGAQADPGAMVSYPWVMAGWGWGVSSQQPREVGGSPQPLASVGPPCLPVLKPWTLWPVPWCPTCRVVGEESLGEGFSEPGKF